MGTNFYPGHNNSWTALWAFGPPFRPPSALGGRPLNFEGRPPEGGSLGKDGDYEGLQEAD
jgi:hypothetical protein